MGQTASSETSPTSETPVVMGDHDIMKAKQHGSTELPVQETLRFQCDREVADQVCCYNRHDAELHGYFKDTTLLQEIDRNKPMEFYDSVSGKLVFTAGVNRSIEEFLEETDYHGWPSFRDDEVNWENVRILPGTGEAVSLAGTHLGHKKDRPDAKGNRYCINLVSIAGNKVQI